MMQPRPLPSGSKIRLSHPIQYGAVPAGERGIISSHGRDARGELYYNLRFPGWPGRVFTAVSPFDIEEA